MTVVRQTNNPTVGFLCFRHSSPNYGSGVGTQLSFRLMTFKQRYSSCGTWWHTRRNQISSFPETDESIQISGERQFSRLLATEVCASALVTLDIPRSDVAWEYWLPTPFASFPFTSPPVRHSVPPGSEWALLQHAGTYCIEQRVYSASNENNIMTTTDSGEEIVSKICHISKVNWSSLTNPFLEKSKACADSSKPNFFENKRRVKFRQTQQW